jgi:hypothetical protein
VHLVATGAVSADASIKAKAKIDHHGGCTDSAVIRLRFDQPTGQLVTV